MNVLLKRIVARLGIIVAVIVALVFGYLFHDWIAPKTPAAQTQTEDTKKQLYVCSMNNTFHPYDSDDHRRKCRYCDMMLIPAGTAPTSAGQRRLVLSERARELARIQTSPVERRFVTAEVRMGGRIYYDETNLRYITAWVPGRIDRLHVDYTGVAVNQGEHLADLYSPDLISAQEEFIQAIEAVRDLKGSDLGMVRETAAATAEAARQKLRLLGLTPGQIAAIEKRGTASDHVTIYAPIGGVVIEKYVKQGQYVKTGTRLYTIADLSEVWVRLDAYESDLVWLRPGQPVTFTADAYPGKAFTGRIALVGPEVDPKTRSVEIRVTVPNPEGKLKPNMFVRAVVRPKVAAAGKVISADLAGKWFCTMHPHVVKDTAGKCDRCEMPLVRADARGFTAALEGEKPLVIPVTAPLLTGKRAIVYVEVPDQEQPTYDGREVTLGPRARDYYIVEAGLKEGERVVTRGNFLLDSDLQIQNRLSMMSPTAVQAIPREDRPAEPTAQAPAAFQKQLAALTDGYFALCESLSGDDFKKAQAAAAAALAKLNAVDMALLQGKAHTAWMKELPSLRGPLTNMAGAKNIEQVRKDFALLSEELPVVIKRFGVGDAGPVYQLHCPMAFNNRGANWLQKDEDVRNPYFGSQMYRCGGVVATVVAPRDKNK